MATPAHCVFCFETLHAHLTRSPLPSLSDIESSYTEYCSSFSSGRPSAPLDPTPRNLAQRLQDSSRSGTSPGSSATSSSRDSSTSTSSSQTSLSTPALPATPPPIPADTVTPPETPVFITWNTLTARGKSLRGCIGTFDPHPVEAVLRDYALTAALEDTRFAPIPLAELPTLAVSVTLLTDFEPAAHTLDWVLGTHGIRIAFSDRGRRYGATYLPDVAVEQGWSKEEAVGSLMRKAGWRGRSEAWQESGIEVKCTRYQGKKFGVDAAVWKGWREWRGLK